MADLKQLARHIFQQTLASIDIPATLQRKLFCDRNSLRFGDQRIDLTPFSRFCVVAIGKAAHAMVTGLERVLPTTRHLEGVVCGPVSQPERAPGLQYFVGGHPTPNAESWNAAQAILSLLA